MAKSALELAVETGKWDAGLKKAKNALDSFTEANGGLQKALSSDSDKMKQFVQMMGRTESTAKTAKGQMNDYKGTIEALTMQYNRMTDAQKSAVGPAYLQAIEQMKQRYKGVADEVAKINQELKQTQELKPAASEGGQSQSILNMMQVFGGNMLTKAADYVANLGGEVISVMNASADLARQAEGVYVAFQRLGRPGLLDELKAATHGTVSEFELMKAAVQFNDFKLPLQELGTMLAFAQQKAKDTGQSVDYMVQSIVTGLGRKSKLILDNLGISAAELTKKMEETGDMTKAVGEIVREQMSKTGDYIDTTADKASRANAELQNQMLELGRNMQEVFGYTGWSDMATGIKTELVGAINFTIETIARAKNAWNGLMQLMGIKDKPQKKPAGDGGGNQKMPDGTYVEQVDTDGNFRSGYWYKGKISWTSAGVEVVGTKREKKKPTKTTTTKPQGPTMADQSDLWLKMTSTADTLKTDDNRYFQSVHGMLGDKGLRQMLGISAPAFDLGRDISETDYKKLPGYDKNKDRDEKKLTEQISKLTSGISSITGGIKAMGFELPNEVEQVIGVVQGVMSVIEGVNTVISIFGNTAMTANTAALVANTTALYAATATNLIPFARGGVVHAAGGYQVPGNRMSGDQIPAMLNSGELVLSQFQQQVLAANLQAGGMQNLRLEASVHGEQIVLAVNNTMKRKNKGELATFR